MQTIANVKTIQVTNLEDALRAQSNGQFTVQCMTSELAHSLARHFAQLAAHHAILALSDPDTGEHNDPSTRSTPWTSQPHSRS